MRKNEITLVRTDIPECILRYLDALSDRELSVDSNRLLTIYPRATDLETAVRRAMHVCRSAGLPLSRHFKSIFISDEMQHSLSRGWKMSKAAYWLTVINGDPDNPVVGKAQMEFLKRVI